MGRITVFDKNESEFVSRGLGVIHNALECTVEERKNGMYELYLEYPMQGTRTDILTEENIIHATTPRGNQLFRIYRTYKKDDFTIAVNARHIFYDLMDNFIEDTNVVDKTAPGALDQILDRTQYEHPFVGMSDLATTANARIVRKNVVEALIGDDDNTFLSRWGGELHRDNFQVKMLASYGEDRGVAIKYGKNLKGLEVTTDVSGVATRIMPEGYNGLFLPEKYVDSPYINNYHTPKIQKVVFSDVKALEDGEQDEEAVPLEEAYTLLRDKVKMLYSDGRVDLPQTTLKVDFIELSSTEEYKDFAVLERVYPFDTVTVRHSGLDLDIKVDMYYYKWDCIMDRYMSIELGSEAANIAAAINKTLTIQNEVDTMEYSFLQNAKMQATKLINDGLGGYVLKTRDELLIMDTDDVNTAKKIWRWNINGLGYSSTGYKGTFGLAMTSDGKIVADFLTTGKLDCGKLNVVNLKTVDAEISGKFNMTGGEINVFTDDKIKDFIALNYSGGSMTITPSSVQIKDNMVQNCRTMMSGTGFSTYIDNKLCYSMSSISGITVNDTNGKMRLSMSNGVFPICIYDDSGNVLLEVSSGGDIVLPSGQGIYFGNWLELSKKLYFDGTNLKFGSKVIA